MRLAPPRAQAHIVLRLHIISVQDFLSGVSKAEEPKISKGTLISLDVTCGALLPGSSVSREKRIWEELLSCREGVPVPSPTRDTTLSHLFCQCKTSPSLSQLATTLGWQHLPPQHPHPLLPFPGVLEPSLSASAFPWNLLGSLMQLPLRHLDLLQPKVFSFPSMRNLIYIIG